MENSKSEFPTTLGNRAEGARFPHFHRVNNNIYLFPSQTLSLPTSAHPLTDADHFGQDLIRQRRFAPSVIGMAPNR